MTLSLRAGHARLELSPALGGRWTSLRIDGLEVLGAGDDEGIADAVRQGCFAMAPYAGRVRDGRLQWRGQLHQLPVTDPPHSLHGTVLDVPWRVVSSSLAEATLEVDFDDRWPWVGWVRQRISLGPDRLEVELSVTANEAMPITMGLHPWFRRRLARGEDLQLDLPAERQYEKDETGLPNGRLVPPQEGPWDDCFICREPITLRWPEAIELSISSSHDHFVVYSEQQEALCVEPQTGPPNAFEIDLAQEVDQGETLRLVVSLTWTVVSTPR